MAGERAVRAAHESGEQKRLLVAGERRDDCADRALTGRFPDLPQPSADRIERFLPGHRAQLVSLPHLRRQQTAFALDPVIAHPPFVAHPVVVHLRVVAWPEAVDLPLAVMGLDVTTVG